MTDRTFDVWVAVGTVLGGGVATFIAVLGGAAVAARHFRREREQRSAVAVLTALGGFRQSVSFVTAGFYKQFDRDDDHRQHFGMVEREMREAAAALRREEGLAPSELVNAVEPLRVLAFLLEGEMMKLAAFGYGDLPPERVNAAIALDDRVQTIDASVRAWLARDVRWWRREPLHIAPWLPEDSQAADTYVEGYRADIVRSHSADGEGSTSE